MHTCSAVQECGMWATAANPSSVHRPAAKGLDYHFITACHYSDAINGNELADNWFTITLLSSVLALGGTSAAHWFVPSIRSVRLALPVVHLAQAPPLQHDTHWIYCKFSVGPSAILLLDSHLDKLILILRVCLAFFWNISVDCHR